MIIKQLTTGRYGHTLNATQVFSPDGAWAYYDTRNDDTHIGRTGSIEKVNLHTGEVVRLYTVPDQTEYGPGVGAVACNPVTGTLIFIHGLYNCNAARPYGMTRRFGALYTEAEPGIVRHAEARVINEPLVPGALRGGTHAHTWSGDGTWISFTYNDHILEALEQAGAPGVKDLRTIGAMAPVRPAAVAHADTAEEFRGAYFAVVTATVTEQPSWGSDAIEKAFDECWVGQNGYIRADGIRQSKAIAFQGNIRTATGDVVTEVFVADLPDDITQARPGLPLEGTSTTRPNVPKGLQQRRITRTTDRRYAGLQGPRYRLRTSPDGREIYFLMRDDNGVVQLYGVPVHGGVIRQITYLHDSIQTQFNVSPDGTMLAFASGNRVWIAPVHGGEAQAVTKVNIEAPVNGVLWAPSGDALLYNQYVEDGSGRWLQIFVVTLHDL
jgi:hypothetical protein